MARTSSVYQRRNALAQQAGFKNYPQQRRILEKLANDRAWQQFHPGKIDLRKTPELRRIAADYWNIVVQGKGNSDAARAVIDEMEAWAGEDEWRDGYIWREFYKEGR